MSILGSIGAAVGGSLANSLFGLAANDIGIHNQQRLADYSAKTQLKLAREMPSAQKQGLINAGINPLVAYGSIGSSGASLAMPAYSRAVGDTDVNSAWSNAKQRELMDSQIKESASRASVSDSQAELNSAKTLTELAKPENIKALTALARKRADYVGAKKEGSKTQINFALPDWLGGIGFRYNADSVEQVPNSARKESWLEKLLPLNRLRHDNFVRKFR